MYIYIYICICICIYKVDWQRHPVEHAALEAERARAPTATRCTSRTRPCPMNIRTCTTRRREQGVLFRGRDFESRVSGVLQRTRNLGVGVGVGVGVGDVGGVHVFACMCMCKISRGGARARAHGSQVHLVGGGGLSAGVPVLLELWRLICWNHGDFLVRFLWQAMADATRELSTLTLRPIH